jgi:hypothetical protein
VSSSPARRADEARAPDRVARGEVVEVLLAGTASTDRQRLLAEDRHGQLAAVHVALEQDLLAVGEGRHDGRGHVGRRGREADPEGAALIGRLDHDREAQAVLDGAERVAGAELLERGLGEGVEVGRGSPASRIACLATTLSEQRMQADTPDAV